MEGEQHDAPRTRHLQSGQLVDSVLVLSQTVLDRAAEAAIKLGMRLCCDKQMRTSLSVPMRLSAVKLSRPDVGSSSTRMAGSMTSSMPMVTRRRSPPLTPRMPLLPPTWLPATCARPSSSSTPAMRACTNDRVFVVRPHSSVSMSSGR